ncbi:MAG: acyl-CoA carboxylase epsilon subunit [Acidimicrobiia bacterium]
MSPLAEIPAGASPEEVAAIVAALTVLEDEQRAAQPPPSADRGAHLDAWVRASRLTGRRAGLIRGPWRLAGRIGRRARA